MAVPIQFADRTGAEKLNGGFACRSDGADSQMLQERRIRLSAKSPVTTAKRAKAGANFRMKQLSFWREYRENWVPNKALSIEIAPFRDDRWKGNYGHSDPLRHR